MSDCWNLLKTPTKHGEICMIHQLHFHHKKDGGVIPLILKQPIFDLQSFAVKEYRLFNPDFSRTVMIFNIVFLWFL